MLVVVLMYSFLMITKQVARLPSTPSTKNRLQTFIIILYFYFSQPMEIYEVSSNDFKCYFHIL